jgi:membrane protease YdiL (CAAX protease family)
MNHLESSFAGKNSFWRYLIMLLAILAASNTIGSIPLFIGIIKHPEAAIALAENPNDLTPLGFDPITAVLVMLLPFIAGLAAFILLVKPLNYKSLIKVINGTDSFRWNRLFISAAIWTIICAIYLYINIRYDPSNFSLNYNAGTFIPLVIISVLLVPFQAALEEIIFRGYLMQGFALLIRNRLFPLIMTSVLFGLMHAFNPEVKEFGFMNMMPQYILFGLMFGIITILDDGIEAAIGAHAANNVFLCIMLTNKSSTLQTPALYVQHNVYPWTDFTQILGFGILLILIMKFLFGWRSFLTLFENIKRKPVADQMT